jgi:type IV pilus assembly protein PilV
MIEVMVALVVITVGLLGVAKMQALSLASTTSATQRSMAALEAASLAAAMHTDRAFWAGGAPPPPATINVNGAVVTSSTAGFPAAASNCLSAPDGGNAPCSSTTLAAYDLQQWAVALNSLLPNTTAEIDCQTQTAPISCSITVSWSENSVSINATEVAAAQADASSGIPSSSMFQNPSYTLYVEP